MKCAKCNEEFFIRVGMKMNCKKCKVLGAVTSVLTVQCEKCNHVFQVPIQSNKFFSVKEE